MQPFADILHTLPADALGWTSVIAVLALYAGLLTASERRQRPSGRPSATGRRQRDAKADWAVLTGVIEGGISLAERAAHLHAAATDRIEAVEYALGRLLEDCAGFIPTPAAAETAVSEQPLSRPAYIPPLAA
jgi:hypothetical protein